jgi:hypothetical protein
VTKASNFLLSPTGDGSAGGTTLDVSRRFDSDTLRLYTLAGLPLTLERLFIGSPAVPEEPCQPVVGLG